MEEELANCPGCGSQVEWTNCRDQDVLYQEIRCLDENKRDCQLSAFCVQTSWWPQLPNLDYETTKMKWNAWVATKPNSYLDYRLIDGRFVEPYNI